MSRNVDLTKPLSEDDQQYLAERPWVLRDAELQGIEIGTEEAAVYTTAVEADDDEDDSEEDETTPPEDEDDEPAAEEEEEVEVDYNDLTVAQLEAEIDARNEDKDEDSQIEPASGRKADLIAALETDDAASAE